MFWTILLISVVLVGISLLLLSLTILFKKHGKFPNTHIGGNKEMAKRGIFCATTQDKMEQKKGYRTKVADNDINSDIISC